MEEKGSGVEKTLKEMKGDKNQVFRYDDVEVVVGSLWSSKEQGGSGPILPNNSEKEDFLDREEEEENSAAPHSSVNAPTNSLTVPDLQLIRSVSSSMTNLRSIRDHLSSVCSSSYSSGCGGGLVSSAPSSPDSSSYYSNYFCDSVFSSRSSYSLDFNSGATTALSRSLSLDDSLHKTQKTLLRRTPSCVLLPRSEENSKSRFDTRGVPSLSLQMPSVVVSDHSGCTVIEDRDSSCDDSSLVSIQMSSNWRKLSDCSTCSFASSISVDEDGDDHYLPSCPHPCCSDQQQFLGQNGPFEECCCHEHNQQDFGDASSDDLSSDWDTEDVEMPTQTKPSGWRKVRNIVHWSPFVQTYKKQKYPWVQLSGHQGNFKAGDQGTILKKLCPREERCLLRLMKDELFPFVPEYKGQLDGECEKYLQLQDLLKDFDNPCVMDCKIGVRTYLEEELAKAKEKSKLRKDMYEKMVQVDPDAPTEEENRMKGITKPRYMVWRETISSTATLGFRIEGMKRCNGTSSKDFKTTRSHEHVCNVIRSFVDGYEHILPQYIQRLNDLKSALEKSQFFAVHELIGSSLLFVHDNEKAGIWMIDFAKTQPLPESVHIDHKSPWEVGNHEDGYLIGVGNLCDIFTSLTKEHHSLSSS